ncbi:MAG: YbjN domain-containing protein [Rhizobiales bacterium]|jgi:hypothetical protein|nr:YbjN domain-containing protein [Hyphomicrobiales bacterium]
MGSRWTAVATGLAMFGWSAAAGAQTMVDATKPDDIAAVLKGFGSAVVEKTDKGMPKISARADGQKYWVSFYGCADDGTGCRSIELWTYWSGDFDLQEVNDWNVKKRFAKIYLDEDDDLSVSMDVQLSHGVDRGTLEDNIDMWVSQMTDVREQFVKGGSGQ